MRGCFSEFIGFAVQVSPVSFGVRPLSVAYSCTERKEAEN